MRDFDSASILKKKREKKTHQNLWFLLSSGCYGNFEYFGMNKSMTFAACLSQYSRRRKGIMFLLYNIQ
jgi:hypothetical protein